MLPPVLFIPGFMQPAGAWAQVAEQLERPTTLLDHREHSFEGRLDEIAAAGEGALLAGYSLGGRLALRAALRDPARYAGVVTVGATAGIDEPAERAARAEADDRLASWIEAAPIEDVVAIWERQPLFADQSEALVESQRSGRLTQDPQALAMLLRTAGQGVLEPVWHELLTLELPVLAIAGARDDGYTRAANGSRTRRATGARRSSSTRAMLRTCSSPSKSPGSSPRFGRTCCRAPAYAQP